jgi:Dolichyl-phosphate-mannose-protein mannosyltransferase
MRVMKLWANEYSVVVALLILFFSAGLYSSSVKSIGCDEIIHIPAGYAYIKEFNYWMNREHPPLAKILAAVPLLFLQPNLPTDHPSWGDRSRQTEFGRQFLFVQNANTDQLVFWARVPMICLGGLLGVYVFLYARDLYGVRAGYFALTLYSFCPNILAQTTLVLTDIGVTCFSFISIYYLWKFLGRGQSHGLWWAGVFFGLSLATKFTAVFLIPVFIVLAGLHAYSEYRFHLPSPFYKARTVEIFYSVRNRLISSIVGENLALSPLSFHNRRFFRLKTTSVKGPLETCEALDRRGFQSIIGMNRKGLFSQRLLLNLTQSFHRTFDSITAPFRILCGHLIWIFALGFGVLLLTYGVVHFDRFISGFWSVFLHNKHGHPAFLMGERSRGGWPQYFLIAFLIKTPVALLLLIALTCLWYHKIHPETTVALKRDLFLTLPVGVMLGAASASHLNIGIRYILPIYPFLFVFVGQIVLIGWNAITKYIVLTGLTAWFVVASLAIAPHYLAYFNEIVGGPDRGYQYLVDSNIDFGQDLKLLAAYLHTHHIQKVKLSYFGEDSCAYRGIECEELGCRPQAGILAVSVNHLVGLTPGQAKCLAWLRDFTPIEKIGHSIFVYDISEAALAQTLQRFTLDSDASSVTGCQ